MSLNNCRPSGTSTRPRAALACGGSRVTSSPLEDDAAALRADAAGDGAQARGLAGAVGAEQRGHGAARDLERDAPQHLHVVVAGLQSLDLEQRFAHARLLHGVHQLGIAEIGLDDVRVVGDLAAASLRPACGRDRCTTMRSDRLMIARMMCSIIRIAMPRSRMRAHSLDHVLGLGRIEAGEHLVEQQEPRPRAERTRELEPLLAGGGERTGRACRAGRRARRLRATSRATSRASLERQVLAAETGADRAIVEHASVRRAAGRSDARARARGARRGRAARR